jgi:hypothetical protein
VDPPLAPARLSGIADVIPRITLPKVTLPQLTKPSLDGPAWRFLSIPVACVAVIAALVLIQGSDDSSFPVTSVPTAETAKAPAAAAPATVKQDKPATKAQQSEGAHLVKSSTFSLAMPPGWERTAPPSGATFAAQAPNGDADATLWLKRDPSLDFPAFEAQSLNQLRDLAGSAKVVNRVAAPTAEASVVTLAADAPANAPRYEVTLRQSGPYSYYLATTLQPSADAETAEDVDLIQTSLLPGGSN